MERAVLALLCLSAAFCLASSVDQCPDDLVSNRPKYTREAYIEPSQGLLVEEDCLIDLAVFYPQYFSPGSSVLVRTSIYVCREGLAPLELVPGTYICESERAAIEPSQAPFLVSDGPVSNIVAPVGDVVAPNPADAQPPSRPAPVAPTTGGLQECPSGPFTRNNYIFSSLSLIVEEDCFVRTRVNGAPGQKRSSVWVCKQGYRREFVRRNQYECVQ